MIGLHFNNNKSRRTQIVTAAMSKSINDKWFSSFHTIFSVRRKIRRPHFQHHLIFFPYIFIQFIWELISMNHQLAMKNELCTIFVVQLKRVCRCNIRSKMASIWSNSQRKSQNFIPWYQKLSLFDNFYILSHLNPYSMLQLNKKIEKSYRHLWCIAHDRATFKPMPSISKRGFVYLQSLTLFFSADKNTHTRARGQNASLFVLGGICDCHVFHDFSFNSHTSLTHSAQKYSDECEWPQKANKNWYKYSPYRSDYKTFTYTSHEAQKESDSIYWLHAANRFLCGYMKKIICENQFTTTRTCVERDPGLMSSNNFDRIRMECG